MVSLAIFRTCSLFALKRKIFKDLSLPLFPSWDIFQKRKTCPLLMLIILGTKKCFILLTFRPSCHPNLLGGGRQGGAHGGDRLWGAGESCCLFRWKSETIFTRCTFFLPRRIRPTREAGSGRTSTLRKVPFIGRITWNRTDPFFLQKDVIFSNMYFAETDQLPLTCKRNKKSLMRSVPLWHVPTRSGTIRLP